MVGYAVNNTGIEAERWEKETRRIYQGIGPAMLKWLILVGVLLAMSVGCSTVPNGQTGGTAAFDDCFTHYVADVNGVQIHYVIGGQGDPVVLLHGFPETWYTWHGVMSEMADRHTVVAPDLRGVGESSLEDSGYDKETMAEDIYQLVRQLGYEKASVVGHDTGAWVAYAYAREHQDETSHLVFMSAALPGFGLEKHLDFRGPGPGFPHIVFFMEPETPEMLIGGKEREYLTGFIGTKAITETDSIDEYVRAYSRPGRLTAAFNQYRALYQDADDNRAKATPELTMPVLALDGENAAPDMPLEDMRQVAENVEGDSVPDAGHYLQEEQPKELADRLLDFLNQ